MFRTSSTKEECWLKSQGKGQGMLADSILENSFHHAEQCQAHALDIRRHGPSGACLLLAFVASIALMVMSSVKQKEMVENPNWVIDGLRPEFDINISLPVERGVKELAHVHCAIALMLHSAYYHFTGVCQCH